MRKSFALVELLVVIAIIAIVAAILFPVFAQAKRSASKSATIPDSKQTGHWLHIYHDDYDDYDDYDDLPGLWSTANKAGHPIKHSKEKKSRSFQWQCRFSDTKSSQIGLGPNEKQNRHQENRHDQLGVDGFVYRHLNAEYLNRLKLRFLTVPIPSIGFGSASRKQEKQELPPLIKTAISTRRFTFSNTYGTPRPTDGAQGPGRMNSGAGGASNPVRYLMCKLSRKVHRHILIWARPFLQDKMTSLGNA